jgi:hypothetical protein
MMQLKNMLQLYKKGSFIYRCLKIGKPKFASIVILEQFAGYSRRGEIFSRKEKEDFSLILNDRITFRIFSDGMFGSQLNNNPSMIVVNTTRHIKDNYSNLPTI